PRGWRGGGAGPRPGGPDLAAARRHEGWRTSLLPLRRPRRAVSERQRTMTTSDTVAARNLETLRAAVTGEVFTPGDVGYDQARQAWNLAADERPAVVVSADPPPPLA